LTNSYSLNKSHTNHRSFIKLCGNFHEFHGTPLWIGSKFQDPRKTVGLVNQHSLLAYSKRKLGQVFTDICHPVYAINSLQFFDVKLITFDISFVWYCDR